MEPQIRYTTTSDGASIAYATMGAGPAVIMPPWIYSFSGRLRVFPHARALSAAISAAFTLVLYDGRGMGLSGRERREYGMDARLLDLDAVVRAVRAEAFALVGADFGGLTAMACAARELGRVTSLVLLNSFSSGERFFTESANGRWNAALGPVTVEQWESVSEAIASRSVSIAAAGANSDDVREVGTALRETWNPVDFLAHRQALRELDVSGELGAIAVPTLVISSTTTTSAVFDHSRELASAIPGARLMRVAYRWTGWDDRDYATLVAFLREHAPSVETANTAATPVAAAARGRTAGASRTILYTDIVGNTDMLQRLGDDAWRAVLRDHERITRETLKQHGGTEVKTTGDGFMASFDSATSAVACAIELQRSFATRNDTAPEPMLVRVGLNAGEPIEEDDDLFGTAVTMAARIMGQGTGGEILVSDVVRGLVSGKNFLFSDRGEFVPKGFDDAVRLYEVRRREDG